MFAMGSAFFGSAASYATLTLTGTYPAATVGTPYSASLAIAGGLTPYSLTGGTGVASGSLPAGLALSIVGSTLVLSGTPTTAATSSFTVSVDSGDGQTATSVQSVVVAAALVHTTLNPADTGSALTLSNGNLSVTSTGVGTTRSTNPKTSGKYYFECKINFSIASATPGIGVASANMNLNDGNGLGVASPADESLKYRYDGGCVTNSAFQTPNFAGYSAGDILMFAIDVGSGHLWAGKNGTWGAGGNPAAGTNFKTFVRNGNVYAAATSASGTNYTFRFNPSDWSYAAPVGFSEWI